MTDPAQRPARLTVGVVGAGKVGSVLGAGLARAGHRVTGACAVSQASRERAAALLPGVPIGPAPEVVAAADLALLAVPDDTLGPLVAGLAAAGAFQPGQVVLHTSGRHGIAILEPAMASQVLPLALHPAMTFTGTVSDLGRLPECCFGITTLIALRPLGEALAIELGGEPVWIEEEDRVLYHAALAHGSNHLVTLAAQAMEILSVAGIEAPDRVLGPLLRAALDNVLRMGDSALTGPVARGDAGTVAEHLRLLAPLGTDVLPTYRALARATAERAVVSGRLGVDAAAALLDVLAEPAPPKPPDPSDDPTDQEPT
ncbi:MAG TPA: DUF2520 domain-containing protein [Candidatus Lustribacter sp.]|nr:DUF2520 domain-containing protein [Candidatus Lustribacter sp.]